MRQQLRKAVVGIVRGRLRRDERDLPVLLESGLALKLEAGDAEAHRSVLERVFGSLGARGAASAVDLDRNGDRFRSMRYKYALFGDRWAPAAGGTSFRLGSRLASSHGIKFDVLVLREGAQIPPHAHEGTVSGMLVMEGEVGFRTFDVIEHTPSGPLLRSGLDGRYGPGGVSTSSDNHHNLHWIKGLSPVSLLFRYSLTGLVPEHAPAASAEEPRHYCIPRRALSANEWQGEWVSEADAKAASFESASAA